MDLVKCDGDCTKGCMKIIIAGGGLAGTLTAKCLLKDFKDFNITLIEDPKYKGKGGVQGESLSSTFVGLLQHYLGEENTTEWLKYSDATIKLGMKYVGWGEDDIYIPQQILPNCSIPFEFVLGSNEIYDYDLNSIYGDCFPAKIFMENGYLPEIDYNSLKEKNINDWSAHLDTSKLTEYISNTLENEERFNYVSSSIDEVIVEDNVVKNILAGGESIDGDLYIDATGISRVLIKNLNPEIEYYNDIFLNDNAVYGKVKFDKIENYTSAITASSGWIWEIPLHSKTSVGYVYSSKFISKEDAIDELKSKYPEITDIKTLKYTPHLVKTPWISNVVCIGISQGFIDPLEGSVLLQTKKHILKLIDILGNGRPLGYIQREMFNKFSSDVLRDFTSYIELHYRGCLKEDTEYWKRVINIPHISDGLSNFINYKEKKIEFRDIDWEKWLLFSIGTKILKPYEFKENHHENSLTEIRSSLSEKFQKEVSKSKLNEEIYKEMYRMEK